MDDSLKTFLAIFLLETVTGLSSSIFTIISLSLAGFQRTNIVPLNMILMSLNISNVFFTVSNATFLFITILWPYFYSVSFLFYFLFYMATCTTTSSAWLTAILCFFYFMKIIPSRPGVLMDMKNKIGAIVWKLILMVGIFSLGGSFLSMLISLPKLNERNSTMNDIEILEENIKQQKKLINIIMMLNYLPLITVVVTTVASTWILKVYDGQMKKNSGTLVNTNVKGYRKAVHTMIGFLIFYVLLSITVIIISLDIFVSRSVGFCICSMVLLSFPTGQSTLLIYSNSGLKQILRKLFTLFTCRNSRE
ncbi:taste receptor type 2 member 14-like [Hyla sarda]|uniref:taste receptor type 2 member 14-like n=1 Tax=Hyla sarda TaxID=327740 RepID=UPI0024C3FBAA|nr:taste receptor type 2 member 14-like [Hyla sarda]